jgi:glycosyltransferase involved in cell wall biosynthesis
VQESKVEVKHLGVDTDVFYPVSTPGHAAERAQTRRELDVEDDELLCIYSGKLTADKNALVIAQAVNRLRQQGRKFRFVCIGEGAQKDAIAAAPWSAVLPFMPYQALARYYRAADIAIWPTNESTSMLDAAACGVTIIVSDGIVYRDHVDGNGLIIRMGDLGDLVEKLESLSDPARRAELGAAGAEKMVTKFSWLAHARERLTAYEQSLR